MDTAQPTSIVAKDSSPLYRTVASFQAPRSPTPRKVTEFPMQPVLRHLAAVLLLIFPLAIFAALPAAAEDAAPQSPPSAVIGGNRRFARAGQSGRGHRRRLYQRHPGARLQGEQLCGRSLCLVPLEDGGHRSLQDHGVHEPLRPRTTTCARRSTTEPKQMPDGSLYSIIRYQGRFATKFPLETISVRHAVPDRGDGGHRLRRRQRRSMCPTASTR